MNGSAPGHFSPNDPTRFRPIWDTLLTAGDFYRHLADLTDYARAQGEVASSYANPDAGTRKAILNVGASGKFSNDRAIAEYAAQIWNVRPCPVT